MAIIARKRFNKINIVEVSVDPDLDGLDLSPEPVGTIAVYSDSVTPENSKLFIKQSDGLIRDISVNAKSPFWITHDFYGAKPPNAVVMNTLSDGILKITSGFPSVAVAETDYLTPAYHVADSIQVLSTGSFATGTFTETYVKALTANTAFSNITANIPQGKPITLIIIQDTVARTVTFTDTIKWGANSPYTANVTPSAHDIVTLVRYGSVLYGNWRSDYQ